MTMTNVENTNLDIFMIGVESSDQQQSRMPPAVTDQKEALPSKNLEWTEQHSVHRQQWGQQNSVQRRQNVCNDNA